MNDYAYSEQYPDSHDWEPQKRYLVIVDKQIFHLSTMTLNDVYSFLNAFYKDEKEDSVVIIDITHGDIEDLEDLDKLQDLLDALDFFTRSRLLVKFDPFEKYCHHESIKYSAMFHNDPFWKEEKAYLVIVNNILINILTMTLNDVFDYVNREYKEVNEQSIVIIDMTKSHSICLTNREKVQVLIDMLKYFTHNESLKIRDV